MSQESKRQISVLFVCMGNICRSPMAEGAFRKCLQESADDVSFLVDSAGTHGYHVDAPPDKRARTVAARRGIDITSLKARCVIDSDFERFDYILAMDQDNLEWLIGQAPDEHHEKIKLFLDFSSNNQRASVPDPYYGPTSGFERVLDIVQQGAESLLSTLIEQSRSR
jgi:protein-tyrosine phosphatase